MSDAPHVGVMVRQFVDDAGRRRLSMVQRTDGSFAYFEEFLDAYFEADPEFDEPEVKVWMVGHVSGLFSTSEDAEADARISTAWLSKIVSQGE